MPNPSQPCRVSILSLDNLREAEIRLSSLRFWRLEGTIYLASVVVSVVPPVVGHPSPASVGPSPLENITFKN